MGKTWKTKIFPIVTSLMGLLAWDASAADWYVATNGNDAMDGATWATAKATIQAAVDDSSAGDTVWVSNGIYATGGRAFQGALTNRVVIDKSITVQSVNGPEVTFIEGGQPIGDAAMRCVYLETNAVLAGFTLTKGATRNWYPSAPNMELGGGGVWCETSAVVSNCIITSNQAIWGGGAYGGTLNNCHVSQNAAGSGGGSCNSSLNNSTLIGNTAQGYGGGAVFGALSNCVLSGNHATDGGGANQVNIKNSLLADNDAKQHGGGTYFAELENCTIRQNKAHVQGGGSYYGTLRNCVVAGNTARIGGGSCESWLYNCTISGNWADSAGGAYRGKLYNCIVYYNEAAIARNYRDSILEHSCTTPMPEGIGNITNEPGLASPSHLMPDSPCIGAGSATNTLGTDIDGNEWSDPPAIGCDEWTAGGVTGALHVQIYAAYTNVAVGFPVRFRVEITGRETANRWQWGDGTISSNRHYLGHTFSASGIYSVVFTAFNDSAPLGVAATVTVQVAKQMAHYVALESTNPVPPFSTWATAATNIQDAIDETSQAGALVWVSNGVYSTGSRVALGNLANRVVIDKPVLVRSVNGPSVSEIQGARDPDFWSGGGAASVRCAFVGSNAVLSGFTLSQGCSWGFHAGNSHDINGGGAWCDFGAVIDACIVATNWAWTGGGGVWGGILRNSLVRDNWAYDSGGGSRYGTINQCTMVGNTSGHGGGVCQCIVDNSIICLNGNNNSDSSFRYCATAPAQEYQWEPSILNWIGNIVVDDPHFVDANNGDFRLNTNSPCIDRGNNDLVWGEIDLDKNPRVGFGTVDMGAYEAQYSVRYWAWAAGITNGLTNYTDCAAGDGIPNLLKYAMGGGPMDSGSAGQVTGSVNVESVPVIHFLRNRNALDVTMIVQGADAITNGVIWQNLAINQGGGWMSEYSFSEDDIGEGLVLCHQQDAGPLVTNRFMRLKVTRP